MKKSFKISPVWEAVASASASWCRESTARGWPRLPRLRGVRAFVKYFMMPLVIEYGTDTPSKWWDLSLDVPAAENVVELTK